MFATTVIALATAALIGASPVSGAHGHASVVEARLSQVVDMAGQPNAPCICDDKGNVLFDGSFRLLFTPLRTVAGKPVRERLSYEQSSAQPVIGGKYLLVVAHEPSRDVVVWKGPLRNGLCLDADEVSSYSLQQAALEFPCRD